MNRTLWQQPVQQASAANISRCPGLNKETGVWWVPEGEDSSTATYCDWCYRHMPNMPRCTQYTDGRRHKCNCDSYKLKPNLNKLLFTVSFWSHDQKTHYPVDADGSVRLPSNSRFKVLVDSKLPSNQYYHITAKFGDQELKLTAIGSDRILHRFNVLLKGPDMEEPSKGMVYAHRGSMKQSEWDLVCPKVGDRLELSIHIYETKPMDYRQQNNKNLGYYRYIPHRDTVACVSTGDRWAVTNQYNDDLDNTNLNKYVLVGFKYDFEQYTVNPIKLEIPIHALGNVSDIDQRNERLLDSCRQELQARQTRLSQLVAGNQTTMSQIQQEVAQHQQELATIELTNRPASVGSSSSSQFALMEDGQTTDSETEDSTSQEDSMSLASLQ